LDQVFGMLSIQYERVRFTVRSSVLIQNVEIMNRTVQANPVDSFSSSWSSSSYDSRTNKETPFPASHTFFITSTEIHSPGPIRFASVVETKFGKVISDSICPAQTFPLHNQLTLSNVVVRNRLLPDKCIWSEERAIRFSSLVREIERSGYQSVMLI